jgi:hypothetical protein
MGFIDEFKRSYRGEEGTGHYSVAGIQVKCPHCGRLQFEQSSALLDSRGLSFFGFDWAAEGAAILVCVACGHIDWFLEKPDRM